VCFSWNEIYNSFQEKHTYFNPRSTTWKNAIRHNLSLHKYFKRIQTKKGSAWIVDEIEYMVRRKNTRNQKQNISEESSRCSTPRSFISNNCSTLLSFQDSLNESYLFQEIKCKEDEKLLNYNEVPEDLSIRKQKY